MDGIFGRSRRLPVTHRSYISQPTCLALLLLAACGGDGPDPGTDAAVQGPSGIFGSCTSDSDCPGEGAICRTAAEDGFPGGYCTIECSDRTPCAEERGGGGILYHNCVSRAGDPADRFTCDRVCRNGVDCGRSGYTCLAGAVANGDGICIPVCESDDQCGAGAFCNVYSGSCEAEPPELNGALTGAPCLADADCESGACIEQGTNTAPTGWIGGYCTGNCILPTGYNTNDVFRGDALPAGTCAGGEGNAVCFPADFGESNRGDLGFCYAGCGSTSDCRQGYVCNNQFQMGGTVFTVGICVPGDCGGGVTCPAGSSCVVAGGGNVCAPN